MTYRTNLGSQFDALYRKWDRKKKWRKGKENIPLSKVDLPQLVLVPISYKIEFLRCWQKNRTHKNATTHPQTPAARATKVQKNGPESSVDHKALDAVAVEVGIMKSVKIETGMWTEVMKLLIQILELGASGKISKK